MTITAVQIGLAHPTGHDTYDELVRARAPQRAKLWMTKGPPPSLTTAALICIVCYGSSRIVETAHGGVNSLICS